MKKLLAIFVLMLTMSDLVTAAEYYRGRTIVGAGIYASGEKSILFFKIDGSLAEMEECANTRRFSINSDAPHYQELVSVVMTAYASGQNNVDVYADESCDY
jgi:hypothetical protein